MVRLLAWPRRATAFHMDVIPFVAGFLILAASAVALVATWRYRKYRTINDAESIKLRELDRRREKARLDEAVLAGTHLANGLPRCQASPLCQAPATRCEPVIARDEALTDFLRRAFGGAARFRVVVPEPSDRNPCAFCEAHAPLAEQEVKAELSEVELQRQDALRETEARLARFVRIGLRQRLLARIAREEEPKKKGPRVKGGDNVVAISSSRLGSG